MPVGNEVQLENQADFLPERKQRELNKIVDILHEEFAARIAGATSQKRRRQTLGALAPRLIERVKAACRAKLASLKLQQ